MAISGLFSLPDELLEAIVFHLLPSDTLAFGSTCTRGNKIIFEPLVWRRHCVNGWKYWDPKHDFKEKLQQPPAQIKWRLLFDQRAQADKKALETFTSMLASQQYRIERVEEISALGYDAKDVMLRLRDGTPDDAEDVLARRYYANTILGCIHRTMAIDKWNRLANRQMVRLEEVLGAFDLFALCGQTGDLSDLDTELDKLANEIRSTEADFEYLTTRDKAIAVNRFLRARGLVGNSNEEDYHALRNNFISMALFEPPHTSLPLISVAIYCAVCRRLGVNARPSNYPRHVHAVVQSPSGATLDGASRPVTSPTDDDWAADETRTMHVDPWRSDDEVPRRLLSLRLSQMGAPEAQHSLYMGATTSLEMTLRTGRNIMNSVTEARSREPVTSHRPSVPDIESAWYGMLWSMMVLGDTSAVSTLSRRRSCLPYLIGQYSTHFPEDLGLLDRIITPMFEEEPREHHDLVRLVSDARLGDQNRKAPSYRTGLTVQFKVGTHFRHKRYGYQGMIIGWDQNCSAGERWIEQMRVQELPRGRDQPFYNVISDDKSARYVAEENIEVADADIPSEALMALAGRYFKRWDQEKKTFVSNVRDAYPED